jgi:acyl carrier protein
MKGVYFMVLEKVKVLLADQFGIDEDSITMETSFAEDLNADSLDIVELIMALEEEFGITVEDEEAENISTVGDIVEAIKEKLQ